MVIADGTDSTALHLLIKHLGAYISEEHQDLKWWYVSTSGNQGHGDGNAEVLVLAESSNLRIAIGRGVRNGLNKVIIRAVKDLLGNLGNELSVVLIARKD